MVQEGQPRCLLGAEGEGFVSPKPTTQIRLCTLDPVWTAPYCISGGDSHDFDVMGRSLDKEASAMFGTSSNSTLIQCNSTVPFGGAGDNLAIQIYIPGRLEGQIPFNASDTTANFTAASFHFDGMSVLAPADRRSWSCRFGTFADSGAPSAANTFSVQIDSDELQSGTAQAAAESYRIHGSMHATCSEDDPTLDAGASTVSFDVTFD
jgi:hypothetical protein